MFRAKVAVSMLVIFAIAGTVLYVQLDAAVTETARHGLEQRLLAARSALEQTRPLRDYAAMAKAEQVAAWPQIVRVLGQPISSFAAEDGTLPAQSEFRYQIHRLMNEEVLVWRTKFEALAAGRIQASGLGDHRVAVPDYFAVVDRAGVGVARANDAAWFGPENANLGADHPALKAALDGGRAIRDVWMLKGSPMQMAVAPIRQGEQVLGGVVLGYRLTYAEARRDKEAVGADVAYFVGPRIQQSSSFDGSKEKQVQKAVAEHSLHTKQGKGFVEVAIGGRTYLGQVGHIQGYASARSVGFLVLADFDAILAQARSPLVVIPLVCGASFLLCLMLVLVFFNGFVKPFEEIDQGVMEIINGNLEHWFEIETKGLSNTMSQNLNIMVCHLSGRPLPEEYEKQADS